MKTNSKNGKVYDLYGDYAKMEDYVIVDEEGAGVLDNISVREDPYTLSVGMRLHRCCWKESNSVLDGGWSNTVMR